MCKNEFFLCDQQVYALSVTQSINQLITQKKLDYTFMYVQEKNNIRMNEINITGVWDLNPNFCPKQHKYVGINKNFHEEIYTKEIISFSENVK